MLDRALGDLIGRYVNPGPEAENIDKASLTDAKHSLTIQLRLKNGGSMHVPVRGRQGRFLDSMEMSRFLARVAADAAKQYVKDG